MNRAQNPSVQSVASHRPRASTLAVAALALLLSACGSGDSTSGGGGGIVGVTSGQFAQQCGPNNPYRADSAAGTNPTASTLSVEKQWIRAYVDEAYLWYEQVPNISPTAAAYSNETSTGYYDSLDNYFSDLTVNPVASDKFSFTYPTKQWNQLSQQGISLGYGAEFAVLSPTIPRSIRVAYVQPGTPAATAGLRRGDTISSVDGFSINDNTQAGVAAINAAVFPSAAGNHTFTVTRNGVTQPPVTMAAADITMTPVPTAIVHNVGGSRVGYIAFHDHIRTAEQQLATAFTNFASQGVNDLVLDLRYNRGGYLYIASQTAYMIAGSARTTGRTFEKLTYNSKRSAETNSTNSITPFYNTTTNNVSLPALNLSRVWVLAGPNTCSASEAIVNGLRGIDVDVRIIGGTSCGKPHGFTAKDNCGISYFPIEFVGVNQKGTADYINGFAPTCAASDDFSRELGDVNEGMLAAALYNRTNGTCSAAFAAGNGKTAAPEPRLLDNPARSNKIHVPFGS